MNHIYRLVWNRKVGGWQAVSELATQAQSGKTAGSGKAHRALGGLLALMACGWSISAEATCSAAGTTVTCIGAANPLAPNYVNGASNLTVNVNSGSSLGVLLGVGGNAMTLTGSNLTLTNGGTIDPMLLGILNLVSSGLVAGNTSSSVVNITNNGVIAGATNAAGTTLLSGLAMNIQNGSGGVTRVVNTGTIRAGLIDGQNGVPADAAAIAIYGGSAITFNNSGTISGRVALASPGSPGLGNNFINSGYIYGSVDLGAGGYNTFTAVTGSSLQSGGGTATSGTDPAPGGLYWAQAGTVSAGGNNNTLMLTNNTAGGAGSGHQGSGTLNASNYLNFQNLVVNSGTWNVNGPGNGFANTTLNGGILGVNDASIFGAGTITSNGGTLQANAAALTLTNDILTNGGLTVAGSNSLALNGVIYGTGSIIKSGAGSLILGSANAYSGGTTLAGGTVQLGNAAALGSGAVNVMADSTLQNDASGSITNPFTLSGKLNVYNADYSDVLTLGGLLSGSGSLEFSSGTLILNGANNYSGGTTLSGGTLILGNDAAVGSGTISVTNSADIINSQSIALGNDIALSNELSVGSTMPLTLNGSVSGNGSLTLLVPGTLTMNGVNTYSGGTRLNNGTLQLGSSTALGTGALTILNNATVQNSQPMSVNNAITLGVNDLSINGSGSTNMSDLSLSGPITGSGGLIKNGPATLALTGTSNFTGPTTVNGGTLRVDGTLVNSNVAVGSGATLGGSGTLGGTVTVNNGGHLTLASGSQLTTGNMVLAPNAVIDAALGSAASSGTPLLNVNGHLTLDGTLNISDAGGVGVGIYRLMSFGGSLTHNGLTFGNLPTGIDPTSLTLQTMMVANQVNLIIAASPDSLQFWDGSETVANGLAEGGSGHWDPSTTNWTTLNGTLNQPWFNDFAVFTGASGTVTVDGTQTTGGLQFLSDGYQLVSGTQGALDLINTRQGYAAVRVDPGVTATLSLPLAGSATLNKQDGGTLVLNGANTYTGGTQLSGGTLVLGSSAALGSGGLTTAAGTTLDANAPLALANAVTLNGPLTFAGGNNLDLSGSLGGSGTLTKTGSGSLTLSGSNAFSGDLNVIQGGLSLAGSNSLDYASLSLGAGASALVTAANRVGSLTGSGDLILSGSGELQAGSDNTHSTFSGTLTGDGALVKTGGGTLTLTGNSPFIGQTAVNGGTLAVNGTLGGGVEVNTGATLTGSGTLGGDVAIGNGGRLALDRDNALTLGSLTLAPQSTLDAGFGTPVSGGGTTLLNVDGNLTLDGTLNVSDLGGFGTGIYHLAGYGGALSDNGMQFGSLPNGIVADNLRLQTTLAHQVNLLVSLPGTGVQFWDGGQLTANGAIDGGSGSWAHGNGNWTTLDGSLNQSWGGDFAVFQNAGGTVTVDGSQTVSGLQFVDNGYRLQSGAAGALNLVNGAQGSAAVRVDPGVTATLDLPLNGAATLNKLDSGTLVLNAANGYTGGTQLGGGGLILGNAGALGSGSLTAADGTTLDTSLALALNNPVVVNGRVTLAGSHDLALNAPLSGSGTLTKQGASQLTLSGDNPFSGSLNVQAGSLALAANTRLDNARLNLSSGAATALSGPVTLGSLGGSGNISLAPGSALQVGGDNSDSVYGGNLSGSGRLSKMGQGSLTLDGQSGVDGGIGIEAGSLIVGGEAGSNASLTGNVAVASGALLGGHGTIAGRVDVANGATLSPGNSTGTLNVTGDINLAPGSRLAIDANPDGSADRIIASGTAHLTGANLDVLAAPGDWAPATQFDIIQASAIDGTFASASSSLAFLTPSLTYNPTSVALTLTRNGTGFADVGVTGNQRATAAAIESQGSGPLYNAISTLTAAQARSAYDTLSGELYASVQGALFDDSQYVRDAIEQRMRAAQGPARNDANVQVDPDSGVAVWLRAYGGWGDRSGTSNAARLNHDSRGTLLGIDLPAGDHWRFGGAGGYGTSNLSLDGRHSSADVTSRSLSLYATGQWQAVNLRLGAAHTWNSIDTTRYTEAGSLGGRNKASYDAATSQVFGELGYAIRAGSFTLEPFAGLAHARVDSDGMREHGGSTALRAKGQTDGVTWSTLGLHASADLATVGQVPLAVEGTVGWQRALDNLTPKRRMAFAEGDTFTVKGAPLAKNTAVAQLGISAQLTRSASVDFSYAGQYGDGYRDNGVRLGVSMSF